MGKVRRKPAKRKPNKRRSEAAKAAWQWRKLRAREAFERRSRASKKGWARRKERATLEAVTRIAEDRPIPVAATLVMGDFVSALAAGRPHREIAKAHHRWQHMRNKLKEHLSEEDWQEVLEDVGETLDLDEDFLEALDESPNVEE